jgi:peptidoglycan hydrolase CwlO-like protein
MGLGSTAKKLQTLADTAEKLYSRMNELRTQLVETQETVQESTERLDRLESEMAEQRAVLDALAREQGLDVERISAEAHIHEAESNDEETAAGTGDPSTDDGDAGSASTDDGTVDGESPVGESGADDATPTDRPGSGSAG